MPRLERLIEAVKRAYLMKKVNPRNCSHNAKRNKEKGRGGFETATGQGDAEISCKENGGVEDRIIE